MKKTILIGAITLLSIASQAQTINPDTLDNHSLPSIAPEIKPEKPKPKEDTKPTMSAPTGTRYTVTSTSTVTKADAGHCGYNDVGVPNMAVYNVEVREYKEYDKNGSILNSYSKTVETYDHCYEP